MAERLSRRTLLGAAVALVVAACSKGRSARSTAAGSTTTVSLKPTPSCGTEPTVAQTEGPYFKPNSPAKTDLYADVHKGTRLVVTGSIVSTSCQPVGRALLDVWQADADGQYDNSGSRLRGHLFADDRGGYRFVTVVPGLYPGRTRHIHVKVQAPNGPVLTTQLYFPGEPRNATDSIFDAHLLMTVKDGAEGDKDANFDFVVRS
jgi:protocatechuate 3,4-dioxygenase beta subunit